MKTYNIDKNWILEIIDKTTAFAKQLIIDHFNRHYPYTLTDDDIMKYRNKNYSYHEHSGDFMFGYIQGSRDILKGKIPKKQTKE